MFQQQRSRIDNHSDFGASSRLTRACLTSSIAAVCACLCSCMEGMSASQANSQFSSKQQSMTGSSAAAQPRMTRATEDAQLATGPVVLATPAATNSSAQSQRAAEQLAASQRGDAQALLRAAAASSWSALRAHAIEAAVENPALLLELAPRALLDDNRGVRFVACMAISEAPSKEFVLFLQPLLSDDSDSVKAAATLALARCGANPDPSPISAMIYMNDAEIRANAYLVLGELGNPSAVAMIRDSLGHGLKLMNPIRVRLIDLAAAEALVKLGDEHEIEPIRAALFAPPEQSELTIVACEAIGRLKDEVSRPMLERLLSVQGDAKRSPEIRLAAATALMQLGGSANMAMLVTNEYITNKDPRIRAMVATLLRGTSSEQAVAALSSLIRDSDPTVQVAAAAGLESAE